MQQTVARLGTVSVALVAYAYSLWDFLVGRKFFAADFYHTHLTFELASRSLAQDGAMPTWLPLVQGGRATFIDMANSYSPFGLDFLLTYLLTKPLGFDEAGGMIVIHTWLTVLLNVLLALGCRLMAQEVLVSRHSADLVFVLSLFSGAFSLARTTAIVLGGLFAPWVLLYLIRLVKRGPDRWLSNAIGLTLAIVVGMFHQFTGESSAVVPVVVIFAVGLWIGGYGVGAWMGLRVAWGTWRGKSTLALLTVMLVLSCAPLVWEVAYFNSNNVKALYGGENPGSVLAHGGGGSRYTLDDYAFERFEWQKLLSYFLGIPGTLETVTSVSHAYPASTVHDFHYVGILGALLIVVGLVAGRNPYLFPIVFTIILYGTMIAVYQSPLLATVIHAGYPLTRHLFFADLHLAPLLALVAGMGLDAILKLGRSNPMPVRLWLTAMRWRRGDLIVGVLCALSLVGALFSMSSLLNWEGSVSPIKGLVVGLGFGVAAIGAVRFSFIAPRPALSLVLIFAVLLLDLTSSQHPAHQVAMAGERGPNPILPTSHPGYDSPLPPLNVLDAYVPLAPLRPEAFAYRDKPVLYHRPLYRYWFVGNRAFYDLMANVTPSAWDRISGYTQPRLRFYEHAMEDISGELTRSVLGSEQGEAVAERAVFIQDRVNAEKSAQGTLEGVNEAGPTGEPRVEVKRVIYDIEPGMIRSNMPRLIRSVTPAGSPNIPVGTKDNKADMPSGISMAENELWWVLIDFGEGREEVVNLVVGQYPLPFERGRLFLDASHDGKTWLSEKSGYLAFDQVGWRGKALDKREWHAWNDERFRYYKILIEPGSPPFDAETLPRFEVGFEGRLMTASTFRTYRARIRASDMRKQEVIPGGRSAILSYSLPSIVGKDISTEPTQGFWHQYDIKWIESSGKEIPLQPTWRNEWYRDGLFQVNYRMGGLLSVSVPEEFLEEPNDRALEVTIQVPETGVRVLSFGANHLRAEVQRDRASWLYYADTWDPYWKATLDGNPVPIAKANLQYKAVWVPAGNHLVEFRHNPIVFRWLVWGSYVLQFGVVLLWIGFRGGKGAAGRGL